MYLGPNGSGEEHIVVSLLKVGLCVCGAEMNGGDCGSTCLEV